VGSGVWASPQTVGTVSSSSAEPGAPSALTRILLTQAGDCSVALTQPEAARFQPQHLTQGANSLGEQHSKSQNLLLHLRGPQQLRPGNKNRPNPPTVSRFVSSDAGMPQGAPAPWRTRLHTHSFHGDLLLKLPKLFLTQASSQAWSRGSTAAESYQQLQALRQVRPAPAGSLQSHPHLLSTPWEPLLPWPSTTQEPWPSSVS